MRGRRERPERPPQWPDDPRGPMIGFSLTVPRMALGTRRLGFVSRYPWLQRRTLRLPDLGERRQWQRSAMLIRLVQIAAGLAVLLLAPGVRPLVAAVLLLGLFAAVVSPARAGQAVVLALGITGWVFGYGAHGSPPVIRVLAFAFALFVLHDATSLAATAPMTANLRPEVLRGWLRHGVVALLVAGVLTAVVYAVGALVSFRTSYPLELAGLVGVATALGVVAWLFSRSRR